MGKSQAAFAAMLGVSPESYRTWDAGRRATPPKLLARARALAAHRNDQDLLPLPVLALLIGVHVKTLRVAARDGRLPVTYDTKTTFRRLRARATPAAARAFRRLYYGRPVKPVDRRAPLTWASVPDDYDVQIRALRRRARIEPGAIGHAGGRGAEGRRLPMGGAETHAVPPVLATNRRASPVSDGANVSGNAPFTRVSYPCGGGVTARSNSRVGMRRRCRLGEIRRVTASTSRSIDSGYAVTTAFMKTAPSHPCLPGCP